VRRRAHGITVADGAIEAPMQSAVGRALPPEALHLFDADTSRALAHGREPA